MLVVSLLQENKNNAQIKKEKKKIKQTKYNYLFTSNNVK